MKKRVFAFLIVFLLALSVLQIRAPIALGYTYDVTLNALRPSSGQKGDYVTINFSGSVYNVTAGAPVSYKSVSVTAYCFTTTVNTTVQTNGSGYFSGSISGTLDSTGSVEAYYSGYSDSQTFHVTSALSVSLSASSPDAVTNQPVTFTASASGGSGTKTYSWTGLGSGSANGSSATGKWSSSGNKTVTVTVTDSSGSASANI